MGPATQRSGALSLSTALSPSRAAKLVLAGILVSFALAQFGTVAPGDSLSRRVPLRAMAQQCSTSLAGAINGLGDVLLASVAAKGEAAARAVFLSPFSVAQALAMLLAAVAPGSASERQLLSVAFGLEPGGDAARALSSQLQELRRALVQAGGDAGNVTLCEADSAWLAPRYQLHPTFQKELEQAFGAKVAMLTGAQPVNSWVSDATHGKIKEIIDDSTASQAALALVNAIYFKGLWELAFDKGMTSRLDFSLPSGDKMGAAMMHRAFKRSEGVQVANFTASGRRGDSVPCVAVRLPYRGGQYSAVVAMPVGELADAGGPLQLAAGGRYAATLSSCRSHVARALAVAAGGAGGLQWGVPEGAVKLWLPRFEVESSSELLPHLQRAGVTAVATPGDITRAAAHADGAPVEDLYVSAVIHKVYVNVDELGTEAAAATAVVMLRSMILPANELLLKFDRPFAFFITHDPSGLALFAGEVQRPDEWRQGA